MNHQKIYDNLIQKAKSENRVKYNGVYYENHHIIPKCLGGSDKQYNRVLLTAREHFVCHKLLTYIYPKNKKIVDAFFRMTFSKVCGNIISGKDYAYARELKSTVPMTKEIIEKISVNTKAAMQRPEVKEKTHVPKSKECKQNISKSTNGKSKKELMIKNYGEKEGLNRYDQFIKKLSEYKMGKKLSKESIQIIKEKRKLQSPPTLGMKQSQEWIERRMIKIRGIKKF